MLGHLWWRLLLKVSGRSYVPSYHHAHPLCIRLKGEWKIIPPSVRSITYCLFPLIFHCHDRTSLLRSGVRIFGKKIFAKDLGSFGSCLLFIGGRFTERHSDWLLFLGSTLGHPSPSRSTSVIWRRRVLRRYERRNTRGECPLGSKIPSSWLSRSSWHR